mgnify:FL=1
MHFLCELGSSNQRVQNFKRSEALRACLVRQKRSIFIRTEMKQFEYNKDDLDLMYSAFSVDFGEDHPLSPTDFIRANGILRIIEKGIESEDDFSNERREFVYQITEELHRHILRFFEECMLALMNASELNMSKNGDRFLADKYSDWYSTFRAAYDQLSAKRGINGNQIKDC